MEDLRTFGINSYRVNELAETFGIAASSVSEKLKDSDSVKSNGKRITGIDPEAVQAYFVSRGHGDLFKKTSIFAIQSCSGGIGKSTISLGLLGAARRIKSRVSTVIDDQKVSPAVVYLDFDSQYSSTLTLLGKPQDDSKPVLKHYVNQEANLEEIITPLGDEVYLIPSNLQNLYLDKVLNNVQTIKNSAARLIKELEEKFGRGFILIVDAPPALSSMNQSLVVALASLDKEKYNAKLISPIRSLDTYGIQASVITISEAREICGAFNLPEPVIYSFLTMYNRVGKTSVEILKRVLENPIIKDTLIDNVVRYTSEFSKSNMNGTSIFNGKSNNAAMEDISQLFLTLFGYEKDQIGNT